MSEEDKRRDSGAEIRSVTHTAPYFRFHSPSSRVGGDRLPNVSKEAMGILGNLSVNQLDSFNSEGFLVLDSFASPEEVQEMRARMDDLLHQFDSSSSSIFSTRNQQQSTDDYLFESAEKISFFFEENAFGDDGLLKQPKELSLDKVGHALHEIDPVFKKYTHSDKISGLLLSLGYKRPVIMQSMYIFKQPGFEGDVVPHQDNSYLRTEPLSCTGLWLALEDATVVNGCLWAIPGSQKNVLARKFIRDQDGVRFDCPSPSYDIKEFVPLEVKAGSLVVVHGDLVHQSLENNSPSSRHAFSLHAVDTVRCTWIKDNWLQLKYHRCFSLCITVHEHSTQPNQNELKRFILINNAQPGCYSILSAACWNINSSKSGAGFVIIDNYFRVCMAGCCNITTRSGVEAGNFALTVATTTAIHQGFQITRIFVSCQELLKSIIKEDSSDGLGAGQGNQVIPKEASLITIPWAWNRVAASLAGHGSNSTQLSLYHQGFKERWIQSHSMSLDSCVAVAAPHHSKLKNHVWCLFNDY